MSKLPKDKRLLIPPSGRFCPACGSGLPDNRISRHEGKEFCGFCGGYMITHSFVIGDVADDLIALMFGEPFVPMSELLPPEPGDDELEPAKLVRKNRDRREALFKARHWNHPIVKDAFDEKARWTAVLREVGVFESGTEAARAGWNIPIEPGWHDVQAGTGHRSRRICILKAGVPDTVSG